MPKANETPRVFTTVATLTMAAIFAWGSQIRTLAGFVWPAIILGSGLFLQWNPLAKLLWRRFSSPRSEAWARGPAGGAIVGLLMVVLAGIVPVPYLPALPAIAGFALAFRGILHWLKETTSGKFITILGALVIGVSIASLVWGSGYQHVDNDKSIAHQISFADPLFHAAIANMIHTHHVPTTGIDGLTRIPYHVGSHWWVSVWSGDSGIGAYEIYPLVMGFFFAPLQLFGILCLAHFVSDSDRDDSSSRRGFSILSLLPLLSVLPGIIPLPLMGDLMIGTSFWKSESACLALGLWLCTMAMVCDWYRSQGDDKIRFGVVLALLLPALIGSALINKISVGAIMLGMAGIGFLRTGLWKNPIAILSIATAGYAYLSIHKWTYLEAYSDQTKKIVPFAFWRDYTVFYFWPLSLPANISWACIAGFLLLKHAGVAKLGDVWQAFRDRKTLAWELLLVAVVLGLLPGLVWRLLAGAAIYFHDCQRWLAIGILTGFCWRVRLHVPDLATRTWKDIPISRFYLGAVVGIALVIYALNLLNSVQSLGDDIARTHGWTQLSDPKPNWDNTRQGVSDLLKPRKIPSALGVPNRRESQPGVRAELVGQLNELYRRPLDEKRKTLLLIPRTNRPFWELLDDGIPLPNEARRKMSVSFAGAALTGFAMVNGIPEYHPKAKYMGYGLELFDHPVETDHFLTAAEVESEAKRKAESWGFRRILVFDHSPETGYSLTVWEW